MAHSAGAMTPEDRTGCLEMFLKTLPSVPSFTQWQQMTGELPPDFDALPKSNALPDPLLFLDGKRKVTSAADWKERRAEIIKLFEMYDIGTMPPKPKLDSITPVDAAAAGRAGAGGGGFGGGGPATPGSVTKIVDLKYGPDSQITTRITLTIPPGDGPFPVTINGSGRDCIGCSFPGSTDAPPGQRPLLS